MVQLFLNELFRGKKAMPMHTMDIEMLPAPPAIIYITEVLGDPNEHAVPHQELGNIKVLVVKEFMNVSLKIIFQ